MIMWEITLYYHHFRVPHVPDLALINPLTLTLVSFPHMYNAPVFCTSAAAPVPFGKDWHSET